MFYMGYFLVRALKYPLGLPLNLSIEGILAASAEAVMTRNPKDRRHWRSSARFPLTDSENQLVTEDRRRRPDRRLNNLQVEERQLQLSEMPGLIVGEEEEDSA